MMMAIPVFEVFLIFLHFSSVLGSGSWSYNEYHMDGPSMWYQHTSECGGQSQSPINFDTDDLIFDSALSAPVLSSEFEKDVGNVTLLNNGHSASIVLNGGMQTSGAGLPGTFNTGGLHFHWGVTSFVGSEHTVDMKRYPMELHIVHLNSKYPSISECLQHPDGLAVLGFFFEEGDANPNYNTLINALQHISNEGNSTYISGFNLGDLLNNDLGSYFRYHGSLTTPPCAEVVTWTVFEKPIQLSSDQLDAFRDLNLGQHYYNNYRPVQRLYNRKVYASQEHLISRQPCPTSGSGINVLSTLLVFVAITIYLF